MPALSITSLAKSFRAGVPGCWAAATILSDVHLALWPGEIVALDGARGSGKSTLLRCAAGLLRPDSGSVLWFGGRARTSSAASYLGVERCAQSGALYAQVERAIAAPSRILLVDDLSIVGALERRIVVAMLERHAAAGAAVLFTANEDLAGASFVSRVVTLEHGVLLQRRKRSAARIAASSPAARARSSARSTYGRSLRSPQ
jgi:ABC-type iron transport system FetAB ATPase subunit